MQRSTLLRDLRKQSNAWLVISLLGAALILLPILYILFSLLQSPNENWANIRQYLLVDYFLNSFFLVLSSGFFSIAIGASLAWLIAAYDFPLKKFFRWALILPLAIPPYVAGYTYSSMLSYTGFVQVTLRNQFGIEPHPAWFDFLSMRGAIFIFTLFLFPYVYMLTRTYLENQSASYIESAIMLGKKPLSLFFGVVLPIARPAIVVGVSLVTFEVLSDYGVTSYFGIPTISVAIFRTWFGMYDIDSAMRLAAWLMVILVALFLLERYLRLRRTYSSPTSQTRPLVSTKLYGKSALAATVFCMTIFALAFVIPVLQLLFWASITYESVLTPDFIELTYHSLKAALLGTVIIMTFALIVAHTARMLPESVAHFLSRAITAGYSIPGAVIAIGVLALFISMDEGLAPVYEQMGLGEAHLILSMSLAMLICGYVIRFMAIGYNAIESGYERIGRTYSEASRLLGQGMTRTFFKVDLPLLKGALVGGFILTFVEIIKELPLVLLLRPFNFETLATKTYQYAGDERIFEASVPSLILIAVSLLSVIIIHQFGRKRLR